MSKDSYRLSHEKLACPVLVKKSPRAKRMTLRVSPTRRDVVLTIPRHTGPKKAGAFVEQHIDWLNRQISALPAPVPFVDGAVIPLEGMPCRLVFSGPRRPGDARRGVVTLTETVADEGAQEKKPARLEVTGHEAHAPRRLRDWLKKRARARLGERVAVHAERLEVVCKRLSVRDQSSRWGSCSSTGTLSFSWRLVLAPPVVLDYVAAHEVAHLREMNHSDRFWKLVARTMPAHEQARQWLREHGQELHRYGVET